MLTGAASETGAGAFVSNAAPTTMVTNSQGAGLSVRIDKLLLINTSAGAITVQLYKVPSAGAISGDDYKVLKDFAIAIGETVDVREVAGMLLENGDSLRAMASAASALKFDVSYWKES